MAERNAEAFAASWSDAQDRAERAAEAAAARWAEEYDKASHAEETAMYEQHRRAAFMLYLQHSDPRQDFWEFFSKFLSAYPRYDHVNPRVTRKIVQWEEIKMQQTTKKRKLMPA